MPTRRVRILLADDDESMRGLCRRLLQKAGLDVDEATDGMDAIRLLQQHAFDGVLTDHRMPRASGIDVLVAACEARPGARRVLMTSDLDPETSYLAREVGHAHAVFEKPSNLDALRIALHATLIAPTHAPA